jgi:hypothetical protein
MTIVLAQKTKSPESWKPSGPEVSKLVRALRIYMSTIGKDTARPAEAWSPKQQHAQV